MRLSRIEIENFKGISKRQVIDLKPITLLFGPNSAGKSTILQALHYVREILERQNPDPDQTIAGGLIDLGGFKALVHNHELDRAITIKLVIDLGDEQVSDRLPLNSGASLQDAEFVGLGMRYLVGENTELEDNAVVQEVGVGLEIRWSDLLVGPYVSSLAVEMDGKPVAAINSPPQEGRAILTDFNFAHPLLQQIVYEHDLLAAEEAEAEGLEVPEGIEGDPFNSPLGSEIWELSRALASPEAQDQFSDDIEDVGGYPLTKFPIVISTVFGALPDIDRTILPDLTDVGEQAIENQYSRGVVASRLTKDTAQHAAETIRAELVRREALTRFLDELVLGPVRIARDFLNTMTYIGPLREIPARSFRARLSPDESRWAQGLAAWDLLYTDVKGDLIEAVNDWLSGENKLRTGYRLEKAAVREIAVPSRMSTLFQRGLTEDDIGELQDLYENLETRVEVALRDFEKGILVAPRDVGVGISQMIPVVVGCLTEGVGLLTVEQPELHIHPAIQVGMGDLLIHAIDGDETGNWSGKSLLIESHSEHIMLRLLRRIRETSEGELPPGAPPLTPNSLSVIYVETADDGVAFHALRVDKDGEFRDRWPQGFFDERVEELF